MKCQISLERRTEADRYFDQTKNEIEETKTAKGLKQGQTMQENTITITAKSCIC